MDKGRAGTRDPAQLQRLLEERTADLQRVKAEYDNYRKRVRRDRIAVREIAVANVLRALLPVLDSVDRVCAHEPMTTGLKDIADTLRTQAGSLGLEAFAKEGDPFDPSCHDALTHHVCPDAEQLICTKILRPGYRLGPGLLRPAHVEVTGPAPPARNPLGHDRPRHGAAHGSAGLTRAGHGERRG
ncbi:nucleotide exchange factor GrpE [Streptomyces broussonetiae]|uniref:Protein GrpE n=1 Tax=Streptomyces broussonetiae TaxID=2686304 RepID=A0A6I6NBP2_9ACTN|nr:nucleotide exchange factor GrpE [Streptomyces broussonetiae]QHA08834.1 nucleotide exchange factor GrpE [Streptomyces broussonetiae]